MQYHTPHASVKDPGIGSNKLVLLVLQSRASLFFREVLAVIVTVIQQPCPSCRGGSLARLVIPSSSNSSTAIPNSVVGSLKSQRTAADPTAIVDVTRYTIQRDQWGEKLGGKRPGFSHISQNYRGNITSLTDLRRSLYPSHARTRQRCDTRKQQKLASFKFSSRSLPEASGSSLS